MRNRLRFDLPLLTAGALLLCAAPAAAQAPAPAPAAGSPSTVSAAGMAQIEPQPEDRKDNASIRRAVNAAREEALPLALAAARRRAVEIGFVSNLAVGQTLSVAETQTPYFGPFGQDAGTFGPGRFCGQVQRVRTRRTASGRIVRTPAGRRRVCRIPRVIVSLTVTYAAAPKPIPAPAPASAPAA